MNQLLAFKTIWHYVHQRRKFKKLLNKDLIHFIGSDAHNMIRNSPTTYGETFELISKKVGDFAVDNINQNAKRLFEIAK